LDGEGGEEAEHEPHFGGTGKLRAEQLEIIECVVAGIGAVNEIEAKYRKQHKQAARLCKNEELERGVSPVLMPPDADEKIHGDQHHFPEEVKQEEVHGQEDAGDSRKHPEEVKVKEAGAVLNFFP